MRLLLKKRIDFFPFKAVPTLGGETNAFRPELFPLEVYPYGKCPKISYKISDNMAIANQMAIVNSAVPDQTAPSGAV